VLTISAREANQQFSRILETAARGEEVTITRRGVPVAKLIPVVKADAIDETALREQRKEEAIAFFRKGLKGGVTADWTRDKLYLDRFEHRWERDE
jgi:prevent-host-death family protein